MNDNNSLEAKSYFENVVKEKEELLNGDSRIEEIEEGYIVTLKYKDILAYREDTEKLKNNLSFDMSDKEKKERFYFFAMSLLGGYIDMVEEANNLYRNMLVEQKHLEELENQEIEAEKIIELAQEKRKKELEEEFKQFEEKTKLVVQEMIMQTLEEENASQDEKELMLSKIAKLNNKTIKEYD